MYSGNNSNYQKLRDKIPDKNYFGTGFVIPEEQDETVCDSTRILSYANNMSAPCAWVDKVKEWIEDINNQDYSYYLNVYVTNWMMNILRKYRSNSKLNEQELEIIHGINKSIYEVPRPNIKFPVIRGHYYEQKPVLGQTITFGITRSASFNIKDTILGYSNDNNNSSIMYINVPSSAIIAYHPSEDQVIFPIGAKFIVISELKDVYIEELDSNVNMFECIYINAPLVPEDYPYKIHTMYGNDEQHLMLKSMWNSDYLFPYLPPKNVLCSLTLASADFILGMLSASYILKLDNFKWNINYPFDRTLMVTNSNSKYTVHFENIIEYVNNIDQFIIGVKAVCNLINVNIEDINLIVFDQYGDRYNF